MNERVLSTRELNRATLARQLLLERQSLRVPQAIERLAGMQAQWPTAAYIGLWSRLRDFDRAELTRALERRTIVRGTLMRVTIHVLSARDFLALVPLWLERHRADFIRRGRDPDAAVARVRSALAAGPRTHAELAAETGGEYDWRVRALLPLVHVPPAGTWRYHGKTPLVDVEDWLGERPGVPDPRLVVERYLRAFGPASKTDLLKFSGLRVPDVEPALDTMRLRRMASEDGRTLLDVARAPLPAADAPAPPRFLGRWDNAIIGYDRRARIVPDEYADRKIGLNGDQVFLVDGFVRGIWTVERAKTAATLTLEALSPFPRAVKREVADEAERLLAWHAPDADTRRVRWS